MLKDLRKTADENSDKKRKKKRIFPKIGRRGLMGKSPENQKNKNQEQEYMNQLVRFKQAH